MPAPLVFSPAEYPFEHGVNMARTPVSGRLNRLLRWYTYPIADPYNKLSSSNEAVALLRLQDKHLGKLAMLGVKIPLQDGRSFVGTSPDSTEQIAVYNLVDYIDAEPLDQSSDTYGNRIATRNRVIHDYFAWIEEVNQPYYLSDISKDDAWGHTTTQLVLFDIEPLFSASGWSKSDQ